MSHYQEGFGWSRAEDEVQVLGSPLRVVAVYSNGKGSSPMMEMDLGIEVRKNGKITVIQLAGELDAYTAARFKEVMVDAIEDGGENLIVSMADVEYIDSSGLGALVGGLKRVSERRGKIVILSAQPQVRKVFEITGLERVFPLFDDEDEAVAALQGGS